MYVCMFAYVIMFVPNDPYVCMYVCVCMLFVGKYCMYVCMFAYVIV